MVDTVLHSLRCSLHFCWALCHFPFSCPFISDEFLFISMMYIHNFSPVNFCYWEGSCTGNIIYYLLWIQASPLSIGTLIQYPDDKGITLVAFYVTEVHLDVHWLYAWLFHKLHLQDVLFYVVGEGAGGIVLWMWPRSHYRQHGL